MVESFLAQSSPCCQSPSESYPDRLVQAGLDALVHVPDVALATIGGWNGGKLVLHWTRRGDEGGQVASEPGDGLYGWVLRTGNPVMIDCFRGDWRAAPAGLPLPDGSCVVEPWCVDGEVVGVMAVHRAAEQAFGEADLRQFAAIRTLIEASASESQARQRQEQQRQHLQALTEMSRVLVAATDPKTVLALVVDMTMTLSPAMACWLFLTDAETGQSALAAARGLPREVLPRLTAGAGYGPGLFQQLSVVVDGEVVGALEFMHSAELHPATHETLQALANMAGIALRQIQTHAGQQRLLEEAIFALVAALEARDPYTQGHSLRVAEFATWLAEALNLDEQEQRLVRLGGYLHDIGKIGIPEVILRKPGRFTEDEIAAMQRHPLIGHYILSHISGLSELLPLVRSHHERLDGSGYPDGLAGDQIPRLVRILAIADVFEALTADRPYRGALSVEKAFAVLEEGAGSHFDVDLVKLFLQTVRIKNALGVIPSPLEVTLPPATVSAQTGDDQTAG